MADLDARLTAVERALTETDRPPADVADAAAVTDRLDACESRLDDLEGEVADLAAAVQAVRGYVGEVRRGDRQVERTAATALATAERLERRLDADTPPDPVPADARPVPAPAPDADTTVDPTPTSDATDPTTAATDRDPAHGSDAGLLARVRDAL